MSGPCHFQKTWVIKWTSEYKVWNTSLWVIAKGGPRGLQTAHTCHCPWLHSYTLLWKTPHILAVGYRKKINLTLTRKLPWLAFMIPYDVMQPSMGEKTDPDASVPTYQPRGIHWYNSGMTIMGKLLCDWIWDLLHRKEVMPGTLVLVKSPYLGKSQALG